MAAVVKFFQTTVIMPNCCTVS